MIIKAQKNSITWLQKIEELSFVPKGLLQVEKADLMSHGLKAVGKLKRKVVLGLYTAVKENYLFHTDIIRAPGIKVKIDNR